MNTLRRLFMPRVAKGLEECTKHGLDRVGITRPTVIHHNLSYDELFQHENKNDEGVIFNTKYGTVFGIDTGKFTGRSPKDKWIVKNSGSESEKNLWWGSINQPTTPEVFDDILDKAVTHFNTLDSVYLYDGYCGASENSKKKVRFVHELSWQQHFVKNMFIEPDHLDPTTEPDFTVINACSVTNDLWKEHQLNSEVAIAFDIERRLAVILGTWYGGENKKGIFSLMNYWLPLDGKMTMHCSANVGADGDTALFFGLSGTGKTTLSVDPNRMLIGDDEHGWDDEGVFNLEGGCYAKTINLTEENEPDIYQAIRRDALLENVWMNDDNTPDYFNVSKTENGRVSYPIDHIPNWHRPQKAGHPNNIIFLTCDAFGVLPPVAKLSDGQAMYHFLSGYTAKVAGTERGVTEPEATFSACFGQVFLTLHPTKYADLLKKKLQEHDCDVYLVNTGWTGGRYGEGDRMSLPHTRACIDSILNGSIKGSECYTDEVFGFEVPCAIPNVPEEICRPRDTWSSPEAYDDQAKRLAGMFVENFKQYVGEDLTDYSHYGPKP